MTDAAAHTGFGSAAPEGPALGSEHPHLAAERFYMPPACLSTAVLVAFLTALAKLTRWYLSKCQHDSHVEAGSIVPSLLVDQMQSKAGSFGARSCVFRG